MTKNPQEANVQLKLENASPDKAAEAARAANVEKAQKYVNILFPLRKGKFLGGYVKSDFVALFNIDGNASTTEAASGATFERNPSSRSEYSSAGDTSANTTQVGKVIVAKGTRSELPRGKTIKVALGTATAKGNLRFAHIRVPSCMHAIEVANWIKTCFRQKTPTTFQMGRTRYSVDALAAAFGNLPETKSSKKED